MAFEALIGLFAGMVLVMLLLGLAWIVLFVWSLVDVLKAENDSTWKILWILVMAFIPLIGVTLYYFIGRDQAKKPKKK